MAQDNFQYDNISAAQNSQLMFELQRELHPFKVDGHNFQGQMRDLIHITGNYNPNKQQLDININYPKWLVDKATLDRRIAESLGLTGRQEVKHDNQISQQEQAGKTPASARDRETVSR